MAELKAFKEFLKKEFPAASASQIKELCETFKQTIADAPTNKTALVNIAKRYGYEGTTLNDVKTFNANDAKEFIPLPRGKPAAKEGKQTKTEAWQKEGRLANRVKTLELVVSKIDRNVSEINAKLGAIPVKTDEVIRNPFDDPDVQRLQRVEKSGKDVKELAASFKSAGYTVVSHPQTVYPELPRGKRDVSMPIYPEEAGDVKHLSPAEQKIRETALTMMVVKAPNADVCFQVMNTPDGKLTMTQLKRGEASRLPRIDMPVPPGAITYSDPLAVRAKVIELAAGTQPKKREASKV